MALVTRYVAITNFSRRQPEFDGEPPFIWAGEDVTSEQIEVIGWTPDEVEMYVAQGALAAFDEELPDPEPPRLVVRKTKEA